MDLWGSRIFVDVVFGVFSSDRPEKVEDGNRNSAAENLLEWRIPPPTFPGRMSKETSLRYPSSVSSIKPSPFLG